MRYRTQIIIEIDTAEEKVITETLGAVMKQFPWCRIEMKIVETNLG